LEGFESIRTRLASLAMGHWTAWADYELGCNSESPHLHFQLMDSPDFETANGLPVVFDNAPTHGVAPVSDAQEATMAAYSDYLFLDPPDTT